MDSTGSSLPEPKRIRRGERGGCFKYESGINHNDREMESLERKTVKQREKADIFYETKLMKLIEEEFVENNKSKVREKVDYLIMSVGTSCEPLILDIQLLKPERIHFLYTEERSVSWRRS